MSFSTASRPSTEKGRAPEPDLTIGIDFGMTGTAVAYASRKDRQVKVLESWQGHSSKKVPSAVSYKDSIINGWGFTAREEENATGVIKAFKGAIDSSDIDHFRGQNPIIHQAAQEKAITWLKDYLEHLREHLESELEQVALTEGRTTWNKSRVLYLFSYPTTWKPETVKIFEATILEAGYGAPDSHQVNVTMNEADAAIACYFTSGELPDKNEHLIIADIGGGTCDIGIHSVDYPNKGAYPNLVHRTGGLGSNVGSTKIDEHFESKVAEILKPMIKDASPKGTSDTDVDALIAAAARDVSSDGDYLAAKHEFGKQGKQGKNLGKTEFTLRKGSLWVMDDAMLKALSSTIKFDKRELFTPAFDEQCTEIWKQLVGHIDHFLSLRQVESEHGDGKKGPQEGVAENQLAEHRFHLILSGGMGKSVYVQNFLRTQLKEKLKYDPRITVADDPQLVVCKGLVESELRANRGENVWKYRAKFSYGVVQEGVDGEILLASLVVPKNMEIQSGQCIQVQIPLELDTEGSYRLSLAEFPDHYPPGRVSFQRAPSLGEPNIIKPGPFAKGVGRKVPKKTTMGINRSTKFDVEFEMYSGVIKCRVAHMQAQIGDDKFFRVAWQCTQVDAPANPAAPRKPLGVLFGEWMNSVNPAKVAEGAKILGIFGAMGFNFAKARDEREMGDDNMEGIGEDFMRATDDTEKMAKDVYRDINKTKKDVDGGFRKAKRVSTAFSGMLSSLGVSLEDDDSSSSEQKT